MSSGIYEIVNTINGNRYVGSAVNIEKRWYEHKRTLQNKKHQNPHLQRAWNKYGADSFKFHVIEHCFFFMLVPREQYYIDELNPEYNISPTAGSPLGVKHTEEVKANKSEERRNYFAKNPVNAETRDKRSKSLKKYYSENPEAKINKSKKAKEMWLSPEIKTKISDTMKKVKGTPEARAKASEAQRKYFENPETRSQQSESIKVMWKKEEEKTKHSNSMKKYYAENQEARTKTSKAVKSGWARRKSTLIHSHGQLVIAEPI